MRACILIDSSKLENMGCSSTTDRAIKRASYVSSYYETGSKAATARHKSTTRKTVRLWVRRAAEEAGHAGDQNLADAPGRGRKSKVKALAADERAVSLLRACVQQGMKCPAMAAMLKSKLDICVSREVVRQFLNCHMAKARKPQKRSKLTAQHKGRRKTFCSEWAEQYKWDDVCVTDSTNFYYPVDHSVGAKEWVLFEDLDDPAPRHSEHKWEIRIHAYAAVTKHGRSKLILAAGTSIKAPGVPADAKAVNADEYVRVLEHGLIPECRRLMALRPRRSQRRKWIFQQDNAPAHTDRKVSRWLQQHNDGFKVLPWPSRSPDLSWIENLWAYVKQQIRKRRDLTRQNFLHVVQDEWDNMDEAVYLRVFNSIERRMKSCIEKDGGLTKY